MTIRLDGGYSLKDLCFLVRSLPTLPEKLSRYDLFLLDVNIVGCSAGRGYWQ